MPTVANSGHSQLNHPLPTRLHRAVSFDAQRVVFERRPLVETKVVDPAAIFFGLLEVSAPTACDYIRCVLSPPTLKKHAVAKIDFGETI